MIKELPTDARECKVNNVLITQDARVFRKLKTGYKELAVRSDKSGYGKFYNPESKKYYSLIQAYAEAYCPNEDNKPFAFVKNADKPLSTDNVFWATKVELASFNKANAKRCCKFCGKFLEKDILGNLCNECFKKLANAKPDTEEIARFQNRIVATGFDPESDMFSGRQRDVLELYCSGESLPDIAKVLGCDVETAKACVKSAEAARTLERISNDNVTEIGFRTIADVLPEAQVAEEESVTGVVEWTPVVTKAEEVIKVIEEAPVVAEVEEASEASVVTEVEEVPEVAEATEVIEEAPVVAEVIEEAPVVTEVEEVSEVAEVTEAIEEAPVVAEAEEVTEIAEAEEAPEVTEELVVFADVDADIETLSSDHKNEEPEIITSITVVMHNVNDKEVDRGTIPIARNPRVFGSVETAAEKAKAWEAPEFRQEHAEETVEERVQTIPVINYELHDLMRLYQYSDVDVPFATYCKVLWLAARYACNYSEKYVKALAVVTIRFMQRKQYDFNTANLNDVLSMGMEVIKSHGWKNTCGSGGCKCTGNYTA